MSTIQTATDVQAPPVLAVKIDEKTVPMTVDTLSIDVYIAGKLSRTELVITFRNPHDQVLEGEFTFPLPDGAALCGYGLDVDGEIVDASLVEKPKARMVFEEEVRKGIDPGLVEQVSGNQFRTRVWPIPAGGKRSIKVQYVSELKVQQGNSVYHLPLQFQPPQRDVVEEQAKRFNVWTDFFGPNSSAELPDQAERFRLRVTVAKNQYLPVTWDNETFGFQDCGDSWVAETRRAESLPDKITITLPDSLDDSVMVERFAVNEYYFQINAHVFDAEPPAKVNLEKIALVWDASLSRATIDKTREFELLRSLVRELGNVEFDVYVLRNNLEDSRTFSIVAGECTDLLEFLARLPCDGGTCIAGLEMNDRAYDAYLMFSDGVKTLGDDLPETGEVPVFAISSDVTADRPFLRHVAEDSGGVHLDLTRLPVAEACEQILTEGVCLLGVECDPDWVTDIFPKGRVRLENGNVTVSGRLDTGNTEVTLRFGRGNRETERRSFRLSRKSTTSTGLVSRLWAQRKVQALSIFRHRSDGKLLDLGRRFHIVTPNASLLVLETLEQHLEHQIAPAASRERMRNNYDDQISRRQPDNKELSKKKLDQVADWWQKRVRWWEETKDIVVLPETNPVGDETSHPQETHPLDENEVIYSTGLPSDSAVLNLEPSPASEMGDAYFDLQPSQDMSTATPQPTHFFGSVFGRADYEVGEIDHTSKVSTEKPAATCITIKPWDPKTPWRTALENTSEDDAYDKYLELRTKYGRSPAFYLDCADYLFGIDQRDMAIRVLTNIAELELESPQLLRTLAYKLDTEDELELAANVFWQVLCMRAEEPQSFRDLALVLDRQGKYEAAAKLLWAIVECNFNPRFPEIETIALMELNRILERARREGLDDLHEKLEIDERLLKLLDQDLRIVLSWDADLTDVDLCVSEPSGENCSYNNQRTRLGGRLSCDFTQGYGPEEYVIHRGATGTYKIAAKYYSSHQQSLTGPVTVFATVFTNYGRPDEHRRVMTVRLAEVNDVVELGTVQLGDV